MLLRIVSTCFSRLEGARRLRPQTCKDICEGFEIDRPPPPSHPFPLAPPCSWLRSCSACHGFTATCRGRSTPAWVPWTARYGAALRRSWWGGDWSLVRCSCPRCMRSGSWSHRLSHSRKDLATSPTALNVAATPVQQLRHYFWNYFSRSSQLHHPPPCTCPGISRPRVLLLVLAFRCFAKFI